MSRLGLAGVVMMMAAATCDGADFHVAVDGDDAAAGTAQQPFATVDRARRAVRQLRQEQPQRNTPVVVTIGDGVYELADTLSFKPADSGTEDSPTIYRAAEGARPILSGGRRISGWQQGEDGRWQVTLDEVRAGQWNFSQLWVDDQRRFRPRSPRRGYHRIADQLPPTEPHARRGHDRFIYAPGDIDPAWRNREDLEVHAIHIWSASRMRIAAIEQQSREVRFTGPTRTLRRWGAFPQGHRYYIDNVAEALSEPGQWYLDRPTGVLTYLPREGERPDSAVVVAPRLDELVVLAGDAEGGRHVSHLRFEGLEFAHSRWVTPETGNSFPQAAINVGAAVVGRAARHVVFDRCVIRHVGRYALGFGTGSRHNELRGCEMVDLGAGGVLIGLGGGADSWNLAGGDPLDEATAVSHNTVHDCTIAHGGRLHMAAVGVWIGHASHNTITHNDIFDFYYTGISVGWTWGYREPSRSHHNIIRFNHIHTIGQRVLSDMGGVYTLGVSPGTVVSDNVIHDVHSFDYGGWGLYTDEGSTGIVMENNLVYRTRTGGFHQHYGRDNIIRNNILAFSEQDQLQRTRREEHPSFTIERNIILYDSGRLLGMNWSDNYTLDRNLYWNTRGQVTFPGDRTLEAWAEASGQDERSIIADPRFVDAAGGDFRLREDSPVDRIGFEPFDFSRAGRESQAWVLPELPSVPRGFVAE